MIPWTSLWCIAAAVFTASAAWSQDSSASCACDHRSTVGANAWLGAATTSQHFWLGYVDDAKMDELGFGITWSHPIARAAAIQAAMTILPYVRFRRPDQGQVTFTDGRGRVVDLSPTTKARGFGFIPFDLGIRGFTQSRVIVSAAAFFGLVWFDRPVPNASAQRRNYLFGLHGGLEVPLDARNYLLLNARVQHLSNGGTEAANEGVENVMFRIGYGYQLRR
jgi:hypothetical protein